MELLEKCHRCVLDRDICNMLCQKMENPDILFKLNTCEKDTGSERWCKAYKCPYYPGGFRCTLDKCAYGFDGPVKEKEKIKGFLGIIEQYEKCGRLTIANNIIRVMESMGFQSQKKMRCWLGKQFGIQETTIYCWFGSSRDTKFPLKLLMQLSLMLGCSLEELLEDTVRPSRNDVRKLPVRKDLCMKDMIVENYLSNPDRTYNEIADELGIRYNTVRRNLLHYFEEQGLSVPKKLAKRMEQFRL